MRFQKNVKTKLGFTLIELLIVMSIIGVLATGAALSFSQSYRSLVFNNSVEDMLTAFRTARRDATSSQVMSGDVPPAAFVVDTTATTLTVYPIDTATCGAAAGVVLSTFTAPNGFTMTATPSKIMWRIPYGDVQLCDGATASTAAEFRITLADSQLTSRSRTITIDRVGGIPETE